MSSGLIFTLSATAAGTYGSVFIDGQISQMFEKLAGIGFQRNTPGSEQPPVYTSCVKMFVDKESCDAEYSSLMRVYEFLNKEEGDKEEEGHPLRYMQYFDTHEPYVYYPPGKKLFSVYVQTDSNCKLHEDVEALYFIYMKKLEPIMQYRYKSQKYDNRAHFNKFVFENVVDPLMRQLAFFHRHEHYHMDIKPDNIMFDPFEKKAIFVDYGLMVSRKQATRDMHECGNILLGTPGYVNPQMKIKMLHFLFTKYLKGDKECDSSRYGFNYKVQRALIKRKVGSHGEDEDLTDYKRRLQEAFTSTLELNIKEELKYGNLYFKELTLFAIENFRAFEVVQDIAKIPDESLSDEQQIPRRYLENNDKYALGVSLFELTKPKTEYPGDSSRLPVSIETVLIDLKQHEAIRSLRFDRFWTYHLSTQCDQIHSLIIENYLQFEPHHGGSYFRKSVTELNHDKLTQKYLQQFIRNVTKRKLLQID